MYLVDSPSHVVTVKSSCRLGVTRTDSVELLCCVEEHTDFQRGRKFKDDLLQGEVVENLFLRDSGK